MFFLKPHFILIVLAALLSACGGGGGSTPPPSTTTPSSFKDISVPSTFTWATTQTASQDVVVKVMRKDGTSVGEVKVLISTFTNADPTGNPTGVPTPIRASELATIILGLAVDANGNGTSATQPSWSELSANFGKLSLPVTTGEVLVEVFDVARPEKQAVSAIVAVKDLVAGVAISL